MAGNIDGLLKRGRPWGGRARGPHVSRHGGPRVVRGAAVLAPESDRGDDNDDDVTATAGAAAAATGHVPGLVAVRRAQALQLAGGLLRGGLSGDTIHRTLLSQTAGTTPGAPPAVFRLTIPACNFLRLPPRGGGGG